MSRDGVDARGEGARRDWGAEAVWRPAEGSRVVAGDNMRAQKYSKIEGCWEGEGHRGTRWP